MQSVKSIVTISMFITLELATVGGMIYAFIVKDQTLFTSVFGIFATQIGAITTYFFTRKDSDSIKVSDVQEIKPTEN
ncbi:MAG: hypothetical protein PHE32_04185 [Candidatus Shapirobacteria bacterium]|nr:hypothetical protein [Candidatus Shapirobacteria bacterium]